MTNIYLDIDGVLLTKQTTPAKHVDEFIKYVVTHYPTYWLTTHCRQKENDIVPFLSQFFSSETTEYIKQIKPTEWNISKTEGIDFSTPFLWFDDNLFEFEKQDLIKHNVLDNWIEVDLKKNEDILELFLSDFPRPVNDIK